MMNVLDAAYNVVNDYEGGAASLGPRIGKAGTTLSHEVTSTGTAKLGLETAVKLTVLSKDYRILEAFAAQCGRGTFQLPSVLAEGGDNVLARLGDVLREQSHVVREVSESLEDGQITENERDSIRREVGQLIATATQLQAEVDRAYEVSAARRQGGAA